MSGLLDGQQLMEASVEKQKFSTDVQAALDKISEINTKADLGDDGLVLSSQLPIAAQRIRGIAQNVSISVNSETGFTEVTADGFNDESGNPVTPNEQDTYYGIVAKLEFIYTANDGLFHATGGQSIQLGETSSTAYRGDRGKIAYDHSQTVGNPHNLTKATLNIENVDNTSDIAKPISIATQTALNTKENLIAAGTTTQYWRGDKTWQTLPVAPTRVKALHTTAIPTAGNMSLGTAYTLSTTAIVISTQSNAIISAYLTFDPDNSATVLIETTAMKNVRIQCDFLLDGTIVDTKYRNIARSDNLDSVIFQTVQNVTSGQVVSIRITATSGANGADINLPASPTANFITIT